MEPQQLCWVAWDAGHVLNNYKCLVDGDGESDKDRVGSNEISGHCTRSDVRIQ